jgi:hypothetical protein
MFYVKKSFEKDEDMTNVEVMLQEEYGADITSNQRKLMKSLYKKVEKELNHELRLTEFDKN